MLNIAKPKLIVVCADPQTAPRVARMLGPQTDVLPLTDPRDVVTAVRGDANVMGVLVEHDDRRPMTGMQTIDLLQLVRETRDDVRRILLADHEDLRTIVHGLHCGAVERIVYKPLMPIDLLAALAPSFLPSAAAARAVAR